MTHQKVSILLIQNVMHSCNENSHPVSVLCLYKLYLINLLVVLSKLLWSSILCLILITFSIWHDNSKLGVFQTMYLYIFFLTTRRKNRQIKMGEPSGGVSGFWNSNQQFYSDHYSFILQKFNPLNPGRFTRRCTTYPDRSAITYQYQYQYRFFGSLNSGNYYISPTSIFIAH